MTPRLLEGSARAAMAALLFAGSLAHAATIDVTIDSTSLNGLAAVLAFDFLDGGPPDNTVTLSPITSNGTPGSPSSSGNVTGSGPWTFSDAGGSFFNELLFPFSMMGTSLSFSFTTTDNAPLPGSVPDAFSLQILDLSATLPLITTNDPTGADALFLFNLGQKFGGAFTPNETGFSIIATAAQAVSEPVSIGLVLSGALALFFRLRRDGPRRTA